MVKNPRLVPAITLVALLSCNAWGDEQATPDMPNDLVGTWQLIARKMGDAERRAAANEMRLLHVTPTHMSRVVYDPMTRKILGAVGGRVTVEGGKYMETIEWADEGSRRGRAQTDSVEFDYKLEKDQLRLEQMAGDKMYVEIWERVKPNQR